MRKSRLSISKQKRLIELFVAGSSARTAADLVDVNKNTASYYFQRLRQLIHDHSEHLEMFEGEVEADESYFSGRGAVGKVPVFGLLKCSGKVFSVIIPDAKAIH
jgi:transposase